MQPLVALVALLASSPVQAGGAHVEIRTAAAHEHAVPADTLVVARVRGCGGDAADAVFTGTAEGVVEGARRSVPLSFTPLKDGWVAVDAPDGSDQWVLSVTGAAGQVVVSVLVPVSAGEVDRDAQRYTSGAPRAADVETLVAQLAP